jgi:chromosome segregation ATPase
MTAFETASLLVETVRDLSDAEACVADVESERDTYRELLRAALDEIAQLTGRLDRALRVTAAQRDEVRRSREELARYTASAVRHRLLAVVPHAACDGGAA